MKRTRVAVTRQRSTVWMGILNVLVCCVVLAGCRTFNVQTDWDPAISFEAMERFQFVEPPEIEGADPFADNSLLRKRVRFAVEKVLTERGYTPVEHRDEADFLVTYRVALDEEIRVDGMSTGGAGYRRPGVGFGSIYSTTNVRTYQESTLILDLMDPSTVELVWRGWGTGVVGTRDRDRGAERVEAGVRAILDEFPPDAGAKRN